MTLHRVLRSYALLDAILCPEWNYRYYSFDCNWSNREQLGSMRDGEGDHFFALFNDSGCFLKGFGHESPMSPWRRDRNELWAGLLDGVPECFSDCLTEPAFDMQSTTFCTWREHDDEQWNIGNIDFPEGEDPDGSGYLLSSLDGTPESYSNWAQDYFEVDIDRDAVAEVLNGKALTQPLVARLNRDQSLALLDDDLKSTGWARNR